MISYKDMGVRTFINASGTITTLGGSIMLPEVLEAMHQAAQAFVDLNELHIKAGQTLAEMIGVPAAFISCGAASGMQLSAAACLTGTDWDKIHRLPNTEGIKNEFVISRIDPHSYIHQGIRTVGGKLVEVGTPQKVTIEDITNGIGPNCTAVVHFLGRQTKEQLKEVIQIAQKAKVAVIVDAAAQLPPRSNLTELVAMGADLAVFSGGKGLRGPQCTGLVVGNKEFVKAVRMNSSPNSAVGRGMKVGKEEILGLMTAIKLFLQKNESEELAGWESRMSYVVGSIKSLPGVEAEVRTKGQSASPAIAPRAYVRINSASKKSLDQVIRELKDGEPSIAVGQRGDEISIDPMTLQDGEEKIIVRRLKEVLS